MTNPDKQMPDEIFVYNDKSSIGDFGFTSMSPKYGYIKYNLASPNQCCGARGKEACMRYDQDGEGCAISPAMQSAIDAQNYIDRPNTGTLMGKPVIDDGLLAACDRASKTTSFVRDLYDGRQSAYDAIQTLVTHALKTREKVEEVTVADKGDNERSELAYTLADAIDLFDTTKIGGRLLAAHVVMQYLADRYPNGVKIIYPPNNRDEEKI